MRKRQILLVVCLVSMLGIGLELEPAPASAQQKEIVWSADEKPLHDQLRGLRDLPDDVRARTTKDLALKVRELPSTENKLRLADGLAGLSTEGDFGHDALQEVAMTLALTLKERPLPWPKPKIESANPAGSTTGTASSADKSVRATQAESTAAGEGANAAREPAMPYLELASLVRYEHVEASLDDEQYRAALARLEADDRKREQAEFSLKDLHGKTWTFSELRGKVVLVNFWATWCPPCRKEMPDLEALYEQFAPQGLVILGISDEKAEKVVPFIHERKVTFPVLLDPERKVNGMFVVEGIPKSFVYDRDGKLAAQSIDMRTRGQFLDMLAKAGIK